MGFVRDFLGFGKNPEIEILDEPINSGYSTSSNNQLMAFEPDKPVNRPAERPVIIYKNGLN